MNYLFSFSIPYFGGFHKANTPLGKLWIIKVYCASNNFLILIEKKIYFISENNFVCRNENVYKINGFVYAGRHLNNKIDCSSCANFKQHFTEF